MMGYIRYILRVGNRIITVNEQKMMDKRVNFDGMTRLHKTTRQTITTQVY